MRIELSYQCGESWEQMDGDARVRHCGRCDHDVVDLSVLTRRQAERVIAQAPPSLCVRYARGADGEARFRPEPPSWLGRAAVAAGAVALTTVLAGAPAHADVTPPPVANATQVAGAPAPCDTGHGTAQAPHDPKPSVRPDRPPKPQPVPPRPEHMLMGKIAIKHDS